MKSVIMLVIVILAWATDSVAASRTFNTSAGQEAVITRGAAVSGVTPDQEFDSIVTEAIKARRNTLRHEGLTACGLNISAERWQALSNQRKQFVCTDLCEPPIAVGDCPP